MTRQTAALVALGVSLYASQALAQQKTTAPTVVHPPPDDSTKPLPDCTGPDDGKPASADFLVCGHLDVVAVDTTRSPVDIGAWVFECRSGLQPGTQRVGTIQAMWWRVDGRRHGQIQQVLVPVPDVAERPDVAAAYRGLCPAVGSFVGFNVAIKAPTEAGIWNLDISVTTMDGAGRSILWRARREGLFVSW